MVVAALRDRYSGARRNPYNEIECGDHYARAMAGWSVLDAVSGFRYNALEDALSFAPADAPREFRCPFVAGSGWGTLELDGKGQQARVVVSCLFGEVRMRKLSWKGIGTGKTTADINGTEVLVRASRKGETSILTFGEPISLRDGDRLEVVVE
jgi:non-lysosomal glucosylceramidase